MRPHHLIAAAIAATTFSFVPAATASIGGESSRGGEKFVPDEVIVRFKGERFGSAVKVPTQVGVKTATGSLKRNRNVRWATPNYIARTSAAQPYFPTDPGRSKNAGGWAKQQWNFLAKAGINAPQAWGNLMAAGRPGGRGVIVAVLDTGVAYRSRGRFKKSPDLARSQFVRGHDFVSRKKFPHDYNGHGTHVASTIAERANNGIGLVGIAYGARIMPIRVLDKDGAGEAYDIARAIRFAARRGADVINLSLEFDSSVVASQIPEIISAVRYAKRKGSVVIAASGNQGVSKVAYPAKASGVFAVGATTESLCQADYSNEGKGLDVVAPGGGRDAIVNGEANCQPFSGEGRDIYQLTFTKNVRTFGYPSGYQGTSMAVPHVSATAALIIASGVLGSKPSPAQIEQRLRETARDLGKPGYDTRYGWGLIDAAAATAPAEPAPPPQ